jgi:cell division protein FtsW
MKIAKNADSRYKSLLAAGITAVTGIQACINFAVVTGSIPPTGVPLPFVSAGGTALVAFMFSSGLLFNIARNQSN